MARTSLYIEHSLVYSNQKPVPIDDVLASLQAMRRISKTLLPQALSKLTNSKIVEIDVLVDAFEYGSFKESFWLQLIFSSERSMKRFQKAFQQADLAGMYKELPMGNVPVVKTIAVSTVVAGLISYGIVKYVGSTGTEPEKALVEANNNTIIMIGAEAYQQDPMAFKGIIETVAAGKQKQLAEDAAKILAPAQNEPDAKVEMGGGLEIPSQVVRTMPREVEFDAQETEDSFKNAKIDIRQTNRDSASNGWRGRVAGMFDDKVKLTLGEGVRIEDLAGKLEVNADITIRYRMNDQKVLAPVEIVIEEIVKAKN